MQVGNARARAYCGAAYGRQWSVDASDLPLTVSVTVRDVAVTYRLVHHPRTHRPARDQLGAYLYMPVHLAATSAVPAPTSSVHRTPSDPVP